MLFLDGLDLFMIHTYGLMLGLGSPIIHTLLMENTILSTLDIPIELVISPHSKSNRYHVPEFQGAPPQNMLEKFNHLHSSLRNAIERAFGVLKMKWRILLGIPYYPDPETQTKIITACICLHNFIRDSKLYDDHFDTIRLIYP